MTHPADAGSRTSARSDQTWSRLTPEALPVVAKANPDLRHRHSERLVAGAFGQGDIDFLSVENGSPADDHYRGAALVLRQSGSRSTGLPSAGCATARGRSSSRFGGWSFTRWVITSESTKPGWASSDGKSAVSIRSSAMCGRLSRSPEWVPAYWPTGAVRTLRSTVQSGDGTGPCVADRRDRRRDLVAAQRSEPRCHDVWASPHYRSQERRGVTDVTQERRRRVALNAGGRGPTTSSQRWSIVGWPRPVSGAVVPEPASSVIPRSVGVIGMAAHASERALVLRCLRLPAARSSRPRAFQNSG